MNHELASQDKLIKATVAMRRTLLWIRKNDISGFRFRVFVYLAALAPVWSYWSPRRMPIGSGMKTKVDPESTCRTRRGRWPLPALWRLPQKDKTVFKETQTNPNHVMGCPDCLRWRRRDLDKTCPWTHPVPPPLNLPWSRTASSAHTGPDGGYCDQGYNPLGSLWGKMSCSYGR